MINGKLSIDYVRDIVKREMSIPDERINIYNQRWKIPPDDELFAVLEYKSTKILANRNTVDEFQNEHQDINTQESIVVGLFSRNNDALKRKEEIAMALASVYSQQVQEMNSFSIARNITLEDLSELEGSAQLNRIDASITVLTWYHKKKIVDYYDQFHIHVTVNA